jgi:hypothetical protein
MRGKFTLGQKTETGSGASRQVALLFHAVSGPENAEWATYTPAGQLNITLKGNLADRYKIGQPYYIDIVDAEDVPTANKE